MLLSKMVDYNNRVDGKPVNIIKLDPFFNLSLAIGEKHLK